LTNVLEVLAASLIWAEIFCTSAKVNSIKSDRRLASEEPNVPTTPPMSLPIPKLNPKP